MAKPSQFFTLALNGSNGVPNQDGKIIIISDYGIKQISIQGTSATSVSVTGDMTMGGIASGAILVNNAKSALTIIASQGDVISGITIDAKGGGGSGTADFIASN